MVVSTIVIFSQNTLRIRTAAKLTTPQDQRVFQHAALLEILHQRGLRTSSKRGLGDQYIAKALDDGEISSAEKREILALHAKHLSERHGQVLATITLHSRGKP